jgi:Asp-tRNA(Asn)/Glu-tRNA(Gln) amidotransferase A subunit family amidase
MQTTFRDHRTSPATRRSRATALNQLGAADVAAGIRRQDFSAHEVMEACLARIAQREPVLHAFAFIDFDAALRRARLADAWQAEGLPLGPLHGVPIGIKDVFDTADMPSEYGSHLYRGRRPTHDAAVVSLLRMAGALVIGKTTTSEFGMYHQSAARNPHDPARSAGVSSAGSAVAVADHMIPVGIGTQHTASTLLPASFCGTVGFKPSFGLADMTGSNILVPRLAHLGILARDMIDVKLLLDVFSNGDTGPLIGRPPHRVGVLRGPNWALVEANIAATFESWVTGLDRPTVDLEIPDAFVSSTDTVMTLLDAHLALRFGDVDAAAFAAFCPPLRDCITRGNAVSARRLLSAEAHADALRQDVNDLFVDLDVLVTLSAPTEATRIEDGPGSGLLTMPWSLCGLPTISLPLLSGPARLPVGVQMIAPAGQDRRLLEAAAWLVDAQPSSARRVD